MHRLVSVTAKTTLVLVVVFALAATTFDALVVAPALVKVTALLASAAASERDLPTAVKVTLARSTGARLKYHVARSVLSAAPSQVEGMTTTSRQFTELGVGLLLPLHLSHDELLSFLASQAYMGQGVHGFAQAAEAYVGVPLAHVNYMQAAKLVVIARAPTAYIESSERLERHARELIATQAE